MHLAFHTLRFTPYTLRLTHMSQTDQINEINQINQIDEICQMWRPDPFLKVNFHQPIYSLADCSVKPSRPSPFRGAFASLDGIPQSAF